ncbi:MAG: GIY-YIG nuclease family protein [Sulfuricaulis sp.]|uniref:GIY-YIG nuclease family protein n=1 Tax=Sulfuricaulis sp. TaxID=2003553 RepID=UPI0025FBF194|nr:GIY-YIG nuclease family protein [Sulfuricaulis sp.]MCR4348098.1 GIY-YIG nuclease family protein [Sulfuricaulis sp.]
MPQEYRPEVRRDGSAAAADQPWFVYIIECSDGSFYTGITNDLERRQQQHNEGTASRYTRSRRPVTLRYQEVCESRSQALIRECSLRLLSRKEKEELVNRGKLSSRGA